MNMAPSRFPEQPDLFADAAPPSRPGRLYSIAPHAPFLATLAEKVLDGSTPGRDRGAGLGLAIVRSFVNLHGGTVTIEKRDPRGTRVTVNLPRDTAMLGAA